MAVVGARFHVSEDDEFRFPIKAGRDPMITLESVRPTLEWALAMYQSAKNSAPVELPLENEEAVW